LARFLLFAVHEGFLIALIVLPTKRMHQQAMNLTIEVINDS